MPATTVTRRRRRDAGQTLPIYLVAIGGLLFLALAFFAVGQAAASRNGAQTAADAAALAAGQKYREDLREGFLAGFRDGTGDPTAWEELLAGRGAPSDPACTNAGWYAGRNDAAVSSCTPDSWPTSFAVTVKSRRPVGDSVIPGTGSTHAAAEAKAVVVPRCTFAADAPSTRPTPASTSTPTPTPGGGKDGGKDPRPTPRTLTCDGKGRTLDPDHLQDFPTAADLFSVRLAR
ncbi:pilus assembly protein TadG-related protein [Streptomyces yunnanensis]|uniref:Flp pilus-assembly TadE/G-like n=1 Tax=Streptomyces yunnanensis TaxID=156453 RepID=A0A9X8QQG1_9ACTN|nr:pilus assembly protein TadG-related protein [Streptomyces yunnanensis]SHL27703.1 Putative Flp pilus-assembly TadE/G-like [Streptomyces yunnanensis]